MDTKPTIRKIKMVLRISLILGIVLSAAGIVLEMTSINLLPNNKALIGLSFIPFAVAITAYVALRKIRNSPEKMKSILISENDERITAAKNKANASAFRILQVLIFFCYFGYTFMAPADIFEAAGWWIVTFLLMAAFILPAIFLVKSTEKNEPEEL